MAQKATKTRAKSNIESLQRLHLGSLAFNGLFLLWHFFVSKRSLLSYFLLSLPAFFCQFSLEKAGRPRYHPQTSVLVNAGDDLGNAGLTEYMFDCVWITWACAILVIIFGNWAWLFWSIVPAFALYKGSGLLGMARAMTGMGSGGPQAGISEFAAPDRPPQPNRKQKRRA